MLKQTIDNLNNPVLIAILADMLELDLKGFQSYKSMAISIPGIVAKVIHRMIKKGKVSTCASKEDYLKIRNRSFKLFWLTVLIDLYHNHNVDIIKEVVNDLAPMSKELEKYFFEEEPTGEQQKEEPIESLVTNCESCNTDSVMTDEDKDDEATSVPDDDSSDSLEKVNLGKQISALEKDVRRRDKKIAKMQDGYKKLAEEKSKLEDDYKKLLHDYEVLENSKQLMKVNADVTAQSVRKQDEYNARLFSMKNILMIGLQPKNGVPFPYKHKACTAKAVFQQELEEAVITDIWLKKDFYSEIHLDAIVAKIEEKYGIVNITELTDAQIELLEFEELK